MFRTRQIRLDPADTGWRWHAPLASRTVLGAIGMRECGSFPRDGDTILLYESLGRP